MILQNDTTHPGTRNSRFALLASVIIASALMWTATGYTYERDIHYSATLAIAIGEGWSLDEARVIASAAQGVDENRSTIAALEFDVIAIEPKTINGEPFYARGPIHQSHKNFRYHCFSEVPDQRSEINAGVGNTVKGRMDDAARVVKTDTAGTPPRVDSLVAIGVAVHCIQDSYSHNGYGGRCPKLTKDTYPGNCYGHAKDGAKDIFRRLFRGDRTNPDHPAVRAVSDLMSAFDATRRYLRDSHKLMNQSKAGAELIHARDLDELAQRLHNRETKPLDDDVRMDCNHEVIAAWLYEVLSGQAAAFGLQPSKTSVSNECKSAFLPEYLANRLELGEPIYPRLSVDARANRSAKPPPFSAANPPYVAVNEGDIADLKVEEIAHEQHSCKQGECAYSFVVRVSNPGQAKSAAGFLLLTVMPLDDALAPFGFKAPLPSVAQGETAVVRARTAAPPIKDYFVQADVQPPPKAESDWKDANVRNDTATCAVRDGKTADERDGRSGARCRRL